MENQSELTIRPRRARQTLFVVAALTTIVTFIGKYLTIFPDVYRPATKAGKYALENYFILEFRLNTGSNLVVYFTAFVLLTTITALFLLVALYKNSIKDPFRFSWFAFTALFLVLSIYMTSALPDKHIKFYYGSWTDRNGWFVFRWQATAAGLLVLAGLFRKFLAHFDGKDKIIFPASIFIFFAGQFIMELFTGRFANFYEDGPLSYAILGAVGELLSFSGLILLLDALLRYAGEYLPTPRFSLRGATQPAAGEYVQELDPRRFVFVFAVLTVVFVVLSFIGQALRLLPDLYSINSRFQESLLDIFVYQFGLNTESNIATHFNTLALAVAAALLLVVAALKRAAKDKRRFGWLVLGLFALYLSIDEQCVLHEKLSKLFENWSDFNGWLEYKWLIPGFIGVGVLALLFIPFFFHLDHKFKALFVVSAALYFAGAFGGEIFSGRWANTYGVKNVAYAALTNFEEFLELNGINLLSYSLLLYVKKYFGEIRLTIEK